MSFPVYHAGNFTALCDELAQRDAGLFSIIKEYGYPPMWMRPPGFETMVLIILEQQVSLASAYAAYQKLKDKVGDITPASILALDDKALRGCYLSRQKTLYVRELAVAVINNSLPLHQFHLYDDETIRAMMKTQKGIGDWTVDIYLIHALNRTDIFPLGDLALVKSLRELKEVPAHTSTRELGIFGDAWKPYRTMATMLLWHRYIKLRNIKLLY